MLKAAVVQLSISNLSRYSSLELEKKLSFLFSQGTESGADLIVFPAYTGLLFAPESRKTLEYGIDQKTTQLVARLSGYWTKEWLGFFAHLASEHGVLVVPGTTLEAGAHGMIHRAHIIDAQGHLVLTQDQTSVDLSERQLGYEAGATIEIAEAGQTKIGLVINSDAWSWEVGRILFLQGAELIISLQAVSGFYDYRRQLVGSWQVAQSNSAFVLESCLVGRGAHYVYQGLSGMFAPVRLCPPIGILSHIDPIMTNLDALDLGYMISPQKEKEGVLIRNLDLQQLRAFRTQDRLDVGFNLTLYESVLPKIYSGVQVDEMEGVSQNEEI